MKKLAIVVVLALAGWCYWSANYGASSSWGVAKRFLTAVGSTHRADAAGLAEGAAAEALQKADSAAGWIPVEGYHGQSFAEESKEKLPSGDVRYVISEILFFDPPGATSAIGGAMAASFRDTVVLSKKSGSWKVVSLDRQFLKSDSTRH